MSWITRALSSSIGKKQVMAVTGLLLSGFLVSHLVGNFLLFAGAETFDAYAHGLESRPWLLYPAEVILAAIFFVHLAMAVRLTMENRRARPGRYAVHNTRGKMTWASATMPLTGVFILVFLILHILHFKFGERVSVDLGGGEVYADSLYWLVIQTLREPVYFLWYIVSVCIVGVHVYHGVQSALRSLGLSNEKYAGCIEWIGRAFGVAIALGYSALPVYAYLVKMPPVVP